MEIAAMSELPLSATATPRSRPATKARGYWATVGRRIRRDKVSMACALVLLLIFVSAILAPWLGSRRSLQGLDDPPPPPHRHSRATRSAPTSSAATCWRG